MTASTSLPEPLEIPPLVQGLLYELAPKGPREILLARQATWAAAHLQNLIGDSPAQPDAGWLRLFSLADRVFHRNLRDLDRLQSRRAAPETPKAAPAPPPRADSHPPIPSPASSRPASEVLRPSRRRADPTHPALRPETPASPLPTADLPFSITPPTPPTRTDSRPAPAVRPGPVVPASVSLPLKDSA